MTEPSNPPAAEAPLPASAAPASSTEAHPRPRPGGRTARTREAVLDAAAELLVEGSPSELTVAQVAARAGVNETTIYRKWGTKDALLVDVLLRLSRERLAMPDTGSLRGDLLAVIGAVADFLRTPAGFALVYLDATAKDETSDTLRDAFWKDRFGRARLIFERAIERGEAVDLDAALLAYEAMIGAMHLRVLERRKELGPDIAERLVELMLTGIARG